MIKNLIRNSLRGLGYEIRKLPNEATTLYRPRYSPWFSDAFAPYFAVAAPKTLVGEDSCYVLERLLRHTLPVEGDVVECGVYKGGTAKLFKTILRETCSQKKLYLFDTFEGMPDTDPDKDLHLKGDFSDTSLKEVQNFIDSGEECIFRKGFIPETFEGLSELKTSFCHIDVDIYQSVLDCLHFLWPRLSSGGVIVFDDYGHETCPGALEAVDQFFRDKSAVPLCLQTGQAIVFKP